MACFYGVLQGAGRNSVTRLGNPDSGLNAAVMRYNGRITVRVKHNKALGQSEFEVLMGPHSDNINNFDGAKVIASGVLDAAALDNEFVPALIV